MKPVLTISVLLLASNFQRCCSVHTEDLFNKGLTAIPANIKPDTEYLIASTNKITEINNLEKYPKLKYLILSNNQIATSDDIRGVSEAKNLQFLDISNNNLLTLNMEMFYRNSKLVVLAFDNNPYVNINGNLPWLPTLETLSLENCGLSKVPWTDFSTIPNLKTLDLLNNPIKDIPEETLITLPEMVELQVDDELCPVLANKESIKTRKIKLSCQMPAIKDVLVAEKPEEYLPFSAELAILLPCVLLIAFAGLVVHYQKRKSQNFVSQPDSVSVESGTPFLLNAHLQSHPLQQKIKIIF